MDCARIRTAISTRLDGEEASAPREAVTAHFANCASCRVFEQHATVLHRQVRVAPARAVPDLTVRILGAIGTTEPIPAPSHLDAWRLGLAFVGAVQIALALPALLLGADAGIPVHTARDLGSFSIALAGGFLFAAWRPRRVIGLFPAAIVLVGCLVVGSGIDVASGRAAAVHEVSHVTELLGLALLWLVGRSVGEDRTTMPTIIPGSA